MKLYAGLDVSQATTAICIIRENGERVWEGSSMTEPPAIAEALTKYAPLLERAVLESGQLSTWLTRELRGLGVPVICVDARQAHKALSARLNKSDSADAESLAQLARTGWFREVHVKSPEADRLRVLLAARRRLISCRKDIEAQLRGTLKTFGIKLGGVTAGGNRVSFREKVRAALTTDEILWAIVEPLLEPRRYQSGQVDYSGRISRSGNSELRACLYEAACAVLNHTKKFSALKSWGLRLAARKGFRKAAVAVARKIAVIMHRIWSDGTVFQWTSRKEDVAVA